MILDGSSQVRQFLVVHELEFAMKQKSNPEDCSVSFGTPWFNNQNKSYNLKVNNNSILFIREFKFGNQSRNINVYLLDFVCILMPGFHGMFYTDIFIARKENIPWKLKNLCGICSTFAFHKQ